MSHMRRFSLAALAFLITEAILILLVDRPLSEYLRQVDTQSPGFINIFRAYTDVGKSLWYLWPSGIGIIICMILIRKESATGKIRERIRQIGDFLLFAFLCIAISGIVTDIIKPILGRARPVELEREGLYTFRPFTFSMKWNSMPSGHSTTAFTLAFLLLHYFPRARFLALLLVLALAGSRVMVNAHYLSDTLAGGCVAFLCFIWLKTLQNRNGIFPITRRLFPIDALRRPD